MTQPNTPDAVPRQSDAYSLDRPRLHLLIQIALERGILPITSEIEIVTTRIQQKPWTRSGRCGTRAEKHNSAREMPFAKRSRPWRPPRPRLYKTASASLLSVVLWLTQSLEPAFSESWKRSATSPSAQNSLAHHASASNAAVRRTSQHANCAPE